MQLRLVSCDTNIASSFYVLIFKKIFGYAADFSAR